MTPRTAALIINPVAGAKRTRLGPEAASRLLSQQGFEVEVLASTRQREAVELASRAAGRHAVVAAMGGDGTVHEVARGLLGRPAALAILPTGSGNDFAFGVGIETAEQGAAAAGSGKIRSIDVAYLGERPFFNTAGFFLSGLVSSRAQRHWRWCGPWRYVMASLATLPTFRPLRASWALEGEPETRTGRWTLAEVGNGPRAGGGFLLCPDADPSDGQLDFTMVGPMGLPNLLRLFPAAARGERLEHPQLYRPRAPGAQLICEREFWVHLDGEPVKLPAGEYQLRLEPARLNVLVP
jgi:diacylglycerol kinase (ATP)